ncbi:MAG: DUF58 domain-containing protein [Candidatus Rokubacteria bacterium]|nr:DUF58 domain-containing protein [Candidatus Rokubacteria bacterium]
MNTNQSLVYQAFSLLLALLGASALSGLAFRARLALRRQLPRFATVGEPLSYRVIVRNETGRTQRDLCIVEDLPDPRPSFEEFVQSREPGEERRNWFDRKVGYFRWTWLLSRNRAAVCGEHPLPPLPPRGEGEVRVELVPLKRGYLGLRGATVLRPDPFGVFKAAVTIPARESVLVLPRRYALPRFELPGTRKYQHGGVALASSVGDSEEFVSLRDYRPGDPLRRLHWKSLAKLGKPVVKEYQDEFFVRHALVLDTFLDAPQSDRFEEAVSVAASFACAIDTQESLLDLLFVGPEAYCFTAGRGLGHVDRMLEILACVRPCRDRSFAALHHLVIERRAALSGCIAILLAWTEERRRFLGHLASLGVPTLVFLVTEAGALEPDVPESVHRLEVGRVAEGLARL